MIDCDGRGSYEVAQRMNDDGTGQRARTASFSRRSARANDDRRVSSTPVPITVILYPP